MEGLLTPVSTSYTGKREEDALVEVKKTEKAPSRPSFKASTPAEALEILKNEPHHESLITTLRFLGEGNPDFSITSPSPIAAQLVHVLVSNIVPNYWSVLFESDKTSNGRKRAKSKKASDLELLLSCLRSVMGLNALLLSLKQLIRQSKETQKTVGGPNIHDVLTTLLQVLTELIQGNETVEEISNSIWNFTITPLKQKAIWNEFVGIVGSGKILGLAAEAEDVVSELSKKIGHKYWIADGSAYSSWLACNITHWARNLPIDSENEWKCCGDLLCKAFRLGYAGKFLGYNPKSKSDKSTEDAIKKIVTSILLQHHEYPTQFERLLSSLPSFEQRNFIFSILRLASRDYLSSIITSEDDSRWWKSDTSTVSAAAALIRLVIGKEESRKNHLMAWLTSSSGAGVGDGIAIRRAVIATLATDKNDIEIILDKSLRQFGDQLYIRHTPTMQQEGSLTSFQTMPMEC